MSAWRSRASCGGALSNCRRALTCRITIATSRRWPGAITKLRENGTVSLIHHR